MSVRKSLVVNVMAMLLYFGISMAIAEDYKPKAHQFTPEQTTKFFKMQAQSVAAQLQLEHTNEYINQQQKARAFQVFLNELQMECGKDHQLSISSDGDPICQEKPKTSQAPPTPQVDPKSAPVKK